MSISIDSTVKNGNQTLESLVSFRENKDSFSFYQEANTPFMITLMSIHPDSIDTSALSVFTPESQFNIPIQGVKGRSRNSMHQHNSFEFNYVLQ